MYAVVRQVGGGGRGCRHRHRHLFLQQHWLPRVVAVVTAAACPCTSWLPQVVVVITIFPCGSLSLLLSSVVGSLMCWECVGGGLRGWDWQGGHRLC